MVLHTICRALASVVCPASPATPLEEPLLPEDPPDELPPLDDPLPDEAPLDEPLPDEAPLDEPPLDDVPVPDDEPDDPLEDAPDEPSSPPSGGLIEPPDPPHPAAMAIPTPIDTVATFRQRRIGIPRCRSAPPRREVPREPPEQTANAVRVLTESVFDRMAAESRPKMGRVQRSARSCAAPRSGADPSGRPGFGTSVSGW